MRSKRTLFLSLLALCMLLALPANAITAPLSPTTRGQPAQDTHPGNNLISNESVKAPEASILVNTLEEENNTDGDCSLREAIAAANANAASDACQAGEGGTTIDTITFTITGTITLIAQLDVNSAGPLVIQGGGEITISGNNSTRIFNVNTGADLTLESLSMINGSATESGGGILNAGTLILKDSSLSNSSAWAQQTGAGGGIYNNLGKLTIWNSTLANNRAFYNAGGGIYNKGQLTISSSLLVGNSAYRDGGGIYSEGNMTITDSTLADNVSDMGSGGGFYNYPGKVYLTNSTLSGNQALSGGGIYNSGVGAIYITNSTLSGNHAASEGGGVYDNGGGGIFSNATITENTAGSFGGGIRSRVIGLSLRNTIVANNTSYNGADCYADEPYSYGYNLIGNGAGCNLKPALGDLIGINPRLGPLQDNGGSTFTHALLPGSLAYNGGNPAGCVDDKGIPITGDQRGLPRTDRCDIGAYEWQPAVTGPYKVYLPCITKACPSITLIDDFSTPKNGWPVFEDQNVRYEYLNQEYRIVVKTTNWWGAARSDFLGTDYVLEVDVRNLSGVTGTSGLIFGLSPDWYQFYAFEINSNSKYAVSRVFNDNWTLLVMGTSSSINPGTATNHLRIERKGSLIFAYANGQLLNILSDGLYSGERAVGLIASSLDGSNVDIRFDNFALYPISCGRASTLSVNGMETDGLKILPFNPPDNWGGESLHGGIR